MKVILFGATGMVGQGVLRECLLDPEVSEVLAVGRAATGASDPKLKELVHQDFTDFSAIAERLTGTTPASSASASRPPAWRRPTIGT